MNILMDKFGSNKIALPDDVKNLHTNVNAAVGPITSITYTVDKKIDDLTYVFVPLFILIILIMIHVKFFVAPKSKL